MLGGSRVGCVLVLSVLAGCGDDGSGGDDAGPMDTDSGPTDAGGPALVVREPREVSAGADHTCAVRSGRVLCWGGNGAGQLGDGTTTDRSAAAEVPGIDDAVEVAAGDRVSCVVRLSGAVECWGSNEAGQLGDGTRTARTGVVAVEGIDDGLRVDVGDDLACALRRSGAISCWGTFAFSSEAARPADGPIRPAHDVNVGYHGCLASDGRAICWGNGGEGELGTGSAGATVTFAAARERAGTISVSEVAAGYGFSCARALDGQAWCWGSGINGVLGDGTMDRHPAPVRVMGIDDAVHVAAGGRNPSGLIGHACAVRETGAVMCWGTNTQGQLGDGTNTNRATPVAATGLTDAVDVAAGGAHSCAVRRFGEISCWGLNNAGQLGDGTTTNRATPVQVPLP